MELQKQLYEIGEYLGAGLYEEPERGPFYRRALALRRFYEKAPLPKYRGGRLYPSGTYDCPLAIKPCSIGGFGIDKAKLDALLPGACDKIREEFGILKSTVPAPHTVAGNMYTHSMPHYKRIAAEGLDSYIPRIEKIADAELREGLLHVVEGIREYLRRIRDYLIASGADEKLIEALSQVPMKPARNIYEALVCHNFVFYLDLCDNEGCLASDLMPYYKGEDITELLREFYKNVNDTGAYSMSLGVDYSPLTVQCLNAARGMRRPMIELFINESCPDEVWNAALDVLRTNGGQPAFYNYNVLVKGLGKRFPEIKEEDLERFCGGGCTETMLEGLCCVGSLDAGINLALILTEVMNEYLTKSADFEEFYAHYIDAVSKVVDDVTREIANTQNIRRKIRAVPIRTLLVDDCIDKGKEFYDGGARYAWSIINFAGMINVLDSMLVIKDYIFESKSMTAAEMLGLLSENNEEFLTRASRHKSRHGIDDSRANALAARLSFDVYSLLDGKKPAVGLGFLPSAIQFSCAASSGKNVSATPDGRKSGAPLCESLGAVSGKDTEGPTAMLSSVTSLALYKALGTPVTNMTVNPEFSNEVLKNLIKSYIDMGGVHLQLTCASKKMLEEAYADPSKHRELVIRVGGYSEYFCRLDDDLKRLVMARMIH